MAETKSYPVRVETWPAQRVAFVRHVGPYCDVGPTFQRFMGWAGQRGLFGPGTMALGICHDDPAVTPPEKIRYDCCVTVGDGFQPEGEVGVQTLAAGDYAIATLRGPYEELPQVYRYLYGHWLPASGRACGEAPPFEVYRNAPGMVKPEDLLTDVCVLLG